MNTTRPFAYGDKVIFTDEFGEEVLGTIVNTSAWGTEGQFGIDTSTSVGPYTRKASEMRHAEHWEVHRLEGL